jgi:hypothetical protein
MKGFKDDELDLIQLWILLSSVHVVKSIATCKTNPYIINQNHIFSKNYCEVISG